MTDYGHRHKRNIPRCSLSRETATLLTSFVLIIVAASAEAREGQRATSYDFSAVLIDKASQEPVKSARVILAPKRDGKYECTIDIALTAMSDSHGEIRIPHVKPGDYVLFYNLSGSLNTALLNKVVSWGRADTPGADLRQSLCPCTVLADGKSVVFDQGHALSIADSGLESRRFDVRVITTADGDFLTVHVPGSGQGPQQIGVYGEASSATRGGAAVPRSPTPPFDGRDATADGTVYDAKTKLSWQRTVRSTMFNWSEAKAYCAARGTMLGGTGWHLPTIEELKTIVGATAFPATPGGVFWSSSPVAELPSSAWALYLPVGTVTKHLVDSRAGLVRCVAGEVEAGAAEGASKEAMRPAEAVNVVQASNDVTFWPQSSGG